MRALSISAGHGHSVSLLRTGATQLSWLVVVSHHPVACRLRVLAGAPSYPNIIEADRDAQVTGIAGQPFELTWHEGKKRVRHIPDLFCRMLDGEGVVTDALGSWGILNVVGQRLHRNKEVSRERPRVQLVQVLEPKFSPDLPRGGVGLALVMQAQVSRFQL